MPLGLKVATCWGMWDGKKEIYLEAEVLHIVHPDSTLCVFYLHA